MADLLGIPSRRLPLAVALVALLAFSLASLQGRFDQTDVKKGIALALAHAPRPGGRTVFDALVARSEGDPRCDGKVVSQLLGDVDVRCTTPGAPGTEYAFRVLLDGKRPPRATSPAAEAIFAAAAALNAPADDAHAPTPAPADDARAPTPAPADAGAPTQAPAPAPDGR